MTDSDLPADDTNRHSREPVHSDDATVMRVVTEVSETTHSDISWTSGAPFAEGMDRDADAPKVLKQRFVLEEKIGSGGMGTVFRARDLRKVEARDHNPHVAIKVLNNDFRKHPEAFIALEREASKSQTLRHKNIVSIFDFDKDGELPFITMELLQGEELADTLRRYPNGLPQELAWKVIADVVSGLEHAHSEGVVHADFKPGNIFVSDRQSAKILDFGIARAIRANQQDEGSALEPKRLAALTPAYASREMLNGDQAEPRDDLYSLGIVMYMVLSGRHPFGRLAATDAVQEGLRPERLKNIPLRKWWMIAKCLSFNRQDRPASASQVREVLFGRPLWQKWGLASAAGLASFVTVWSLNTSPVDIAEVRQEVRQETLVAAQVERINDLLKMPKFDGTWERTLLGELDELRHLAVLNSVNQSVQQRAASLFADFIAQHSDLSAVQERFALVQKTVHMQEVEEAFRLRLHDELDARLAQPADETWVAEVQRLLTLATNHFPDDEHFAEQRQQLAEQSQLQLPELLLKNPQLAASLWSLFGDAISNEEVRQATTAKVELALKESASREARAEFAKAREQVVSDMQARLDVSCLRIAPQTLADQLQTIPQQHRSKASQLIDNRLQACLKRLSALDPGQAKRLRQEMVVAGLGSLAPTQADPCAAAHLVNNGRLTGRRGSCTDTFENSALEGPRLVVVDPPDADTRFAISKYEISWAEFSHFCQASATCEFVATDLPVTGIPLSLVEAYVAWLSRQTGRRYRLPLQTEWQMVAAGDPDPNRNCLVELAGVRRGHEPVAVNQGRDSDYGLVNVLGNARELIRGQQGVLAAGGGFDDPIEACRVDATNSLDAAAEGELVLDNQTGFRLVREVS